MAGEFPTVGLRRDVGDPALASSFERERWAIFARQWLLVGTADTLARPGHYLAEAPVGFPVVVVNDGGTLRAFHNICRHRSGPLVWDGSGSCSRFVCRYHGWSYGLDGSLQNARDFGDPDPGTGTDTDPGTDTGTGLGLDGLGLRPIAVGVWRGLVFVALEGSSDAGPLEEWIGSLDDRSAAFGIESFVPVRRSSHEIAANWKIYAENYLEGYHIPLVHPGLNRQIDARRYEVEVDGPVVIHSAPTRDGSATAGAWLWRYPSLALNIYPSGMCVEQYLPVSPTVTRVEYTFAFVGGVPPAEVAAAVAASTTILDEDRVICEAVQRAMSSGLAVGGPLSPRHEAGVAQFRKLVETDCGNR